MSENLQQDKGGRLIVCIYEDKTKKKAVLTLGPQDDASLKRLNGRGYGIFETANSFYATEEQLKESGYPTKRHIEFLSRLNEVFADLDICKDDEGLAPALRELRKQKLKAALDAYCPPSVYIITKNGLQPRWWINEERTDAATQQTYVGITNGIIEWSKKNGAKGDPVKDVTRVLRKEGYYHLKSEPYLITKENGCRKIYTLDELKSYFWVPSKEAPAAEVQKNSDSAIAQIAALDIRQVAIDAWAAKGNSASFDKQGHLIVDGVVTATFKGRQGDGNYIATTSSDYPAKGNPVTYVSRTLNITRKEAFKWLCKKYVIDQKGTGGNEFKSALAKGETKDALFTLSKHLIEKHSIKTVGGKHREMYAYSEGVYVPGEDLIKKEIRELLEELCTNRHSAEIVETIKALTTTDRKIFEVDPNFINCENGICDLRERKFIPHDPKYAFLTKIPVTYDETADCPLIKKFLQDVLETEDVRVIQEWFGYALYRDYFIKKALICIGEGDTGKSTLISLFAQFIGGNNVSGVSLQKISTDKFAAASLYNKHINLFDDLSPSDVRDNGNFKIATGGSVITGEKKFGDPFVFSNYSKLTFACNKIPDIKDTGDEAYYKRWIVIPFNRPVDEEDQDKQLKHKLTTPEELSGLLNFALDGLADLLKFERFSYSKDMEQVRTFMQMSSSSIAQFASECLEEAPGESIDKTVLYNSYASYASERKIAAAHPKKFSGRLQACAPYIADFKPFNPVKGKQAGAWRNVKFKAGRVPKLPDDTEADSFTF